MNLTNKHNLPEEVVKALTTNRYSGDKDERKSDYSASTICQPIQQTVLKRRYPDCNTGDVIDNLWSMFGSIAHSLLEEHGSDKAIIEERFFATVLGRTISGQVDHLKDGIITDYKTTSAFKVSKKSYSDWENQLNIYAWLARHNGFTVRNIRIIAIIRDWNERDIDKTDYPKAPIAIIPITLWTPEEQEAYVYDRISLLTMSEHEEDTLLLPCSDDDMWASASKWAITKKGGKRAFRVFDTEEELKAFDPDLTVFDITERKGERRRCAKYCAVSSKCSQYQAYLKEMERG